MNLQKLPIITLTTDWGNSDWYVGAVKGVIYNILPEARIIDITHQIDPNNIIKGAFILQNAWHSFPIGTIHIIGINNQDPHRMRYLLTEYQGHYFLGSDNGIFSMIFDLGQANILELKNEVIHDSFSFPGKQVFAPIACQIAKGVALNEIAIPCSHSIKETRFAHAEAIRGKITGEILYIDWYGNLISNIRREHFERAGSIHNFEVQLAKSRYELKRISKSYLDEPQGELLGLFNEAGFFEIAINEGRANQLLGMKMGDNLFITFEG